MSKHSNKHHSKKPASKAHSSNKSHDSVEAHDDSEDINTEAQNEGVGPSHEAASEPMSGLDASDEVFASTASEEDTFGDPQAQESTSFDSATEEERQKIHLNFFGADIIREKAPKVMEVADQVADEWVQDGQFDKLQLGNPLADHFAGKALRKAKDVEKKLEEKGVFMMAKIGIDYAKSKLHKK